MTEEPTKITALQDEALRIIEDCKYSSKAHYDAASRWKNWNYWIGGLAILSGVVSSGAIIGSCIIIAPLLSMVSVSLTVILTFLNPSDKSEAHKASADKYLSLKNETRIFLTIDLLKIGNIEGLEMKLKDLAQRRNDINTISLGIPNWAYRKAHEGIVSGEADYRVDRSM